MPLEAAVEEPLEPAVWVKTSETFAGPVEAADFSGVLGTPDDVEKLV